MPERYELCDDITLFTLVARSWSYIRPTGLPPGPSPSSPPGRHQARHQSPSPTILFPLFLSPALTSIFQRADQGDILTSWEWWNSWASQGESNGFNSQNPNVKFYYGLPGNPDTNDCGDGYVSPSTMKSNINAITSKWASTFGGLMNWDAA
jgi:hypothetical protein